MLTWPEVVNFDNVLFLFYRFINARRRIVQPMIDQSNRAGKSPVVTVFKSRRCKSSTSQSPPDISPGNHGNDVFDTGGWKHGKKENEQNCHGDKKLKKIVFETLRNAIHFYFGKIQQPLFGFLGCWMQTVTWPGAIDQSEKTFTSTVNMHAFDHIFCFTSLHCMLVKALFLHAWETYRELNMD